MRDWRSKAGVSLLMLLVGVLSACASLQSQGPSPQGSVWVCHGGRNPKWQRVSASAADAHHRHGDEVSETPRPEGEKCR